MHRGGQKTILHDQFPICSRMDKKRGQNQGWKVESHP